MKMERGERSVLAYFGTEEAARACEARLQSLEVTCRVDGMGMYPAAPERNYSVPGSRGETSLANAIFYGYDLVGDESARVLMAASPTVSGMSGEGPTVDGNFLLTVICSEQTLPQVLAEVERAGGRH